jgi:hypothetical protein
MTVVCESVGVGVIVFEAGVNPVGFVVEVFEGEE